LNQNPEQLARDKIYEALLKSGWIVQSYKHKNIAAGLGVAIREYPTDTGPADYILFVNRKPVGVIEAKRPEEGVRLTVHEDQSNEYATVKFGLEQYYFLTPI
jgi:type I restriction enzyme, R subunit